ncbi:cyclic AMP-dependent transcription factor ATF-2 [Microdochium nivale]|nr:cyclic AMP-dependent transcription factor ATF-2 [Microdochium nivale]
MDCPVDDPVFTLKQRQLWHQFDACDTLWGVCPNMGAGIHGDMQENLSMVDAYARPMDCIDPAFVQCAASSTPPWLLIPEGNTEDFAVVQSPTLSVDFSARSIDALNAGSSDDTSFASPAEMKYQSLRERNRVAANKCREKAKVKAEVLQEQERELSKKHQYLVEQVQSLKSEVLDLKNEIICQGNCSCKLMSEYIAKAARSSS